MKYMTLCTLLAVAGCFEDNGPDVVGGVTGDVSTSTGMTTTGAGSSTGGDPVPDAGDPSSTGEMPDVGCLDCDDGMYQPCLVDLECSDGLFCQSPLNDPDNGGFCTRLCDAEDCPSPTSGEATPVCTDFPTSGASEYTACALPCYDTTCPDDLSCYAPGYICAG